jgi:transcriptional accessory protein Tex/SPT6
VGDEIEVKILRVDKDERKIGLSRKRLEWAEEEQEAQQAAPEPKEEKKEKEKELKGGLGASISRLIQPFLGNQAEREEPAKGEGFRRDVTARFIAKRLRHPGLALSESQEDSLADSPLAYDLQRP